MPGVILSNFDFTEQKLKINCSDRQGSWIVTKKCGMESYDE